MLHHARRDSGTYTLTGSFGGATTQPVHLTAASAAYFVETHQEPR